MPAGYVYILTNRENKVLYVGVTNSLRRRIYEHRNKLVEGFSKRYNTIKLIYYKEFPDIKSAISEEKRLKNLVRRKKEDIISAFNPNCVDLYDEVCETISN